MCGGSSLKAGIPSAPIAPLACADCISGKVNPISVAREDNNIWEVEMRGPQIMRNISQLLADKVWLLYVAKPN